MRTKEEILKSKSNSTQGYDVYPLTGILEVLLDIRDLKYIELTGKAPQGQVQT